MKNLTIEIKWAVIFSVMMLAWLFLERLFGFHDERIAQHIIATNFVMFPAIAVYVFALLDKKKNYYNGEMNYKQGFLSGFYITIFVVILSPLVQYLIQTVISPQYFPNMIEFSVAEGYYDSTESAAANFNLKSYIMQSLIGSFVLGTVTSAIVAIFVKSKGK